MPEAFAGAPEAFAGVPEAVAGAPQEVTEAPQAFAGAPEEVARAPEPFAGAPKAVARAPVFQGSVFRAFCGSFSRISVGRSFSEWLLECKTWVWWWILAFLD